MPSRTESTTFADWVRRAQIFVERVKRLPGIEVVSMNVVPPLSARASRKLEGAYSQFLDVWEQLAYIGPEIWRALGYKPIPF